MQCGLELGGAQRLQLNVFVALKVWDVAICVSLMMRMACVEVLQCGWGSTLT